MPRKRRPIPIHALSGIANPYGYPDNWDVHRCSVKKCQVCGLPFIKYGENHKRTRYCGGACRKEAQRKRSHVVSE